MGAQNVTLLAAADRQQCPHCCHPLAHACVDITKVQPVLIR
jgi:hypothetical protein